MRKTTKFRTTLFWMAAVGFSSNSSAFIDPDEWKMDKWGKWDEWDGPPDMKKWRTDQWGDMDQWGVMPNSDRRLPWEMRSGSMPWKNGGGNWGSMPWGGNRSGWGNNMPWGGGNNYNMPWGGNRGNWGTPPWQSGPQQGWGQPNPYYGGPQQGWGQQQPQMRSQQQPYRAEAGRYPARPQQSESTVQESTAPSTQQ